MTVKFDEHSHKSEMVRRNLVFVVICISERDKVWRSEPVRVLIYWNKDFLFVLIIELKHDFCNSICCKSVIFNTKVGDINQSFRFRYVQRNSFIMKNGHVIIVLKLNWGEEFFPWVTPQLSFVVPNSWTRIPIRIMESSLIIFSIKLKINWNFSKVLFIWISNVF